jgi:hypothetical protein
MKSKASDRTPLGDSFSVWLKAQTVRDDRVGDLARDAAQDPGWPVSWGLQVFMEHLDKHGACCEAYTALRAAWAEYHQQGFEAGAMPDPLILEDLDDQPDKVLPAMQQLNTIGFCLLQSRVTGAIAAVVQDEIDKDRVPPWLVAYSFEELRLLAEGEVIVE